MRPKPQNLNNSKALSSYVALDSMVFRSNEPYKPMDACRALGESSAFLGVRAEQVKFSGDASSLMDRLGLGGYIYMYTYMARAYLYIYIEDLGKFHNPGWGFKLSGCVGCRFRVPQFRVLCTEEALSDCTKSCSGFFLGAE